MITRETKDRILQNADIVAIVSETVRLRRDGTRQKGCCPFHGERTPSFVVYPQTNTFKCYGCGAQGNVIDYVMKRDNLEFPEACKLLGRRYAIPIEDREEAPEERVQRLKRESMQICCQQVADYYRQQFLECKEAQQYAYRRWGKEYCDRINIGYAPKGGKALSERKFNAELLAELGLVSPNGYDIFQHRITINICDRFGKVIGFTARALAPDDTAKYKNSRNSDLFNKSDILFGIETAWNTTYKTQTAYLVEGAPDCMRLQSIGILNTFACLGSAYKESHFKILRRAAKRICFVPDKDTPKPQEPFGHGAQVIFEAGQLALSMGFEVMVKEIPDGNSSEKQDPDSYFTSIDIFNDTPEEEFILWYARKQFSIIKTNDDKSRVVGCIAKMLASIDNPTKANIYIDSLTQFQKGKAFWRQAVDEERKRQEEKAASGKNEDSDIHKKYGFWEQHGKYYTNSEKGAPTEMSNFTMQPLFHIIENVMPKRLYILRNEHGVEKLVEMKQEDLVSIQKFRLKVEGMGNFIWKAKETELLKLKSYLYEQTETAMPIEQLGWQKQGFFAFGNGIFFNNKWMKTDEYGIVRLDDLGNFYIPSASKIYQGERRMYRFEREFVHLNLSQVTLQELTDKFFSVYGDNGKIGFSFLLASLFHDIVVNATSEGWFPILNLFGPKGSGKSEMAKRLLRFFSLSTTLPTFKNSTLPALNDIVAQSANAIVGLDEYKNSLSMEIVEFLKGLWDGTGRTRMNMDLDKRREQTPVDAGIILMGQDMPTADIALFSRVIFLQFPKAEFTMKEKEEYMALQDLCEKGLTHLTLDILKLRHIFENAFPQHFRQTVTELAEYLADLPIEDRILKNWAVPIAAFRCLETSLNINLSYRELFNIATIGIKNQNAECKTGSEIGNFWNTVQYLVAQGDIIEDGDFIIKYHRKFKSDRFSEIQWNSERPVLYMQKSRIFKLYRQSGKSTDEAVVSERTLKYYLEQSNAFLGEKNARYTVYRRGQIVYTKSDVGKSVEQRTVQRSLCFDYLKIKEAFDVDLERSNGNTLTDEEREAAEEQAKNNPEEQDLPF